MNPSNNPTPPEKESVWDYPRPPRLERSSRRIRITFNGELICETREAYRVLETSHPPVYYVPPDDIKMQYLHETPGATFCEFKGTATYYDVEVQGERAERAAWTYREPTPAFAPIRDYVALYPSKMEACYVDEEQVQAQEGDFYGGWITSEVVGPFKGGPGTLGW